MEASTLVCSLSAMFYSQSHCTRIKYSHCRASIWNVALIVKHPSSGEKEQEHIVSCLFVLINKIKEINSVEGETLNVILCATHLARCLYRQVKQHETLCRQMKKRAETRLPLTTPPPHPHP